MRLGLRLGTGIPEILDEAAGDRRRVAAPAQQQRFVVNPTS
jgi:hypothetical protein